MEWRSRFSQRSLLGQPEHKETALRDRQFFMSHGQATRSIFGRARVIHFIGASLLEISLQVTGGI
jgi:hypothetical protein